MRIRKRVAFVSASAAICGVGMLAFAGSASAAPPLCVPPPPNQTAGNQSCVRGQFLPRDLPNSFANISLYTQVATRYLNPGNRSRGGFAKRVTVMYDNHGRINPLTVGTAPKTRRCPVAAVANKTIPQAYRTCGPQGRNAYLSPPGTISGKASTAPPSNFGACTMVFQGRAANRITLYTRVFTVPNSKPNCTVSNGGGNVTIVLEGTISNAGVAGFGKKLVTPLPEGITLPLDLFYATVKRGNFVQARCPAGASPLRIRAIFVYSVTTAPYQPDGANFAQRCF